MREEADLVGHEVENLHPVEGQTYLRAVEELAARRETLMLGNRSLILITPTPGFPRVSFFFKMRTVHPLAVDLPSSHPPCCYYCSLPAPAAAPVLCQPPLAPEGVSCGAFSLGLGCLAVFRLVVVSHPSASLLLLLL